MVKELDPDKPETKMTEKKEKAELDQRTARTEEIVKWQEKRKKKGH